MQKRHYSRVVNIDKNTRLVTSVDSRNGDEGSGRTTASVSDLNLSTRDVELSTTEGARDMHRNVFNADEVS